MDFWHYARPGLAASHLGFAKAGIRSQTLFAARGIGKTQFVLHDLLPAAREAGHRVIYCDLWADEERPAKALVAELQRAARGDGPHPRPATLLDRVRELTRRRPKSIQAKGKALGVELEGQLQFADVPAAVPERDIDAFNQAFEQLIAHDAKPLYLVLDEAQSLADVRHAPFVKAMRAAFQRHDERVVRVFTGSSRAGLDRLFHRKKAALFEQGGPRTPFPPLDRGFIDHIAERYAAHTRGAPFDKEAAWKGFNDLGRSARLFRAALDRVLTADSPDIARACRDVLQSRDVDRPHRERWERMQPIDQAVFLRIVQDGEKLFSQPVRRSMAALLLQPAVEAWEVQAALDRLENAHLVYRDERGVYAVEDDEFRVWLEEQIDPDAPDAPDAPDPGPGQDPNTGRPDHPEP